jgi:hypothetical protein
VKGGVGDVVMADVAAAPGGTAPGEVKCVLKGGSG